MHTNPKPNYIAELNAFDSYLRAHSLPALSQLLWYRLIALFNACCWIESVQLDLARMMLMLGTTSKQTALHARDALVEAGLLRYEPGKKGSPSRYRMCYFSLQPETGTEPQTGLQTEPQTGLQTGLQTEPYPELKAAPEPQAEPYPEPQVKPKTEPYPELQTEPKAEPINKQNKKETKQDILQTAPAALRDVFTDYEEMRRKMRRPLTVASAKLVLNKLAWLAPGNILRQQEILNQSIRNGWQDVFPLRKSEMTEDDERPPASYDIEEMERRLLYGKIEYKKRD